MSCLSSRHLPAPISAMHLLARRGSHPWSILSPKPGTLNPLRPDLRNPISGQLDVALAFRGCAVVTAAKQRFDIIFFDSTAVISTAISITTINY